MSAYFDKVYPNKPRHKVFVSYHHANDQVYRNRFEYLFSQVHDILDSWSVQIGDLDPNLQTETIRRKIREDYLRDSTVTVVLVGTQTWQRKHVDWEIYSSLRETSASPRSGLLGILLPTYRKPITSEYDKYTVPRRLYDNVASGFAKMHDWSENPAAVAGWIHEAFLRRSQSPPPDNSYPMFANNRSGERWFP